MREKSFNRKSFIRSISLRRRLLLIFVVIIVISVCFNIVLLLNFHSYTKQYNEIVESISKANNLSGTFQKDIDRVMYNIISGYRDFDDGEQYKLITSFNDTIEEIMASTNDRSKKIDLDIILRTSDTLKKYVDMIGKQIKDKELIEAQNQNLDQVNSISKLINSEIQDYIMMEVNATGQINAKIQSGVNNWIVFNIVSLAISIVLSIFLALYISDSVSIPIKKLIEMSKKVSQGDFSAKIEDENHDEISKLGESFNEMTIQVKELLDKSISEQIKLRKAEFRVLQAQINPHFLYNTLDTIVWMAEAKQNDKVILLVRALSQLFRKSLSKGKDIITVAEEIEQVKSYLSIQKIRYNDILEYAIDIDDKILNYFMPKLILQPLVENALYHGLKNKRTGGQIDIIGRKFPDDKRKIVFHIIDNGIGMEQDTLDKLIESLSLPSENNGISDRGGFGLINVHQRLQLYFGDEYGIQIRSAYNIGTEVTVNIPVDYIFNDKI